jgi:hypothetical protein
LLLLALPARAETPYPRGASEPGTPLRAWPGPDAAPAPQDQLRALVDQPHGPDSTDVLLFVPRLALALPRALLIVVGRPLEGLAGLAERRQLPQAVYGATHNEPLTAGIVPRLAYLTDFGGSFGLELYHDNVISHGEGLALLFQFGGEVRQRTMLTFGGDHIAGAPVWVRTRFLYEEDPTSPFVGLGNPPEVAPQPGLNPRAAAVSTRYRENQVSMRAGAGPTLGPPRAEFRPGLTMIYARRDFGPSERSGDRSIQTVYDVSELPGFVPQAITLEMLASARFDARPSPRLSYGLEAYGGPDLPVGDFRYWRWGAAAGTQIALSPVTRTLRLRAALDAATGPSDRLPFFAQPALGGADRLRGYLTDRFRDDAAVLGSVEYAFFGTSQIGGLLFVDVGRVGDDVADVFRGPLGDWHAGYGGGLTFLHDDKPLVHVLLAYGDSLRLYVTTDIGRLVESRGPRP